MNKDEHTSSPNAPLSNQQEDQASHLSDGHESYENASSIIKKIDPEDFMERFDSRKLFLGVQRHLFTIIACIALWGGIGAFATYTFLTTQKASTILLYQKDDSKRLANTDYTLTHPSLATTLDMIKAPSHLQAVRSILGLELTLKELDKIVEVPTPRNESNLIEIVCTSDNPNLAIDIANTLARVSVKDSQEFNRKQIKAAIGSFKEHLTAVEYKLAAQIQNIENFKRLNRYFEMNPDHSSLLAQMEQVHTKLQNSKLHYTGLAVEYENLRREVGALPDQIIVPAKIEGSPLQTRITSLETTLAETRSRYAAGNPKIKTLETELEDLLRQARADVFVRPVERLLQKNEVKEKLQIDLMKLQSKVRSAQKKKQDVAISAAKVEKELEGLPKKQMTFVRLLQAKQTTEEQLKFLNNTVDAAQLILNVPKGTLELYQIADSAAPWKDSWWVELLPILGLFFGFGVGVAISFLLEMKDPKMRTRKQINLAYTLPCLTTIPEISFLTKKNAASKTLFFIRNLAEQLEQFIKRSSKSRRHTNVSIALASSLNKEGKSCLAYHLALYYQRLGKKTVLIEFDYRHSIFTERTKTSPAHLEDFLCNKASLKEITVPGNIDKIKLQTFHSNIKEWIKSDRMTELWEALKENYDVIIADTPSIIEDDYTPNVAKLCNLCLFIVGSSQTPKYCIDESLRELLDSAIKPCGIVLNRVNPAYIDDERIKRETRRNRKRFLQEFLAWESGEKKDDEKTVS